jgi:hypothetical protein
LGNAGARLKVPAIVNFHTVFEMLFRIIGKSILCIMLGCGSVSFAYAYNQYSGNVSFLSNQVDSSVNDVVGNRFRAGFVFDFKQSNPGELEKNFSLTTEYNDAGNLLFSLREANLVHRFGSYEVTYGRKVLDWSISDRVWGFGKLNNRVNINFFEPGQEGLTGIKIKKQYESGFYIDSFLSVVNVPELNPGFDINNDDGTITKKNPWSSELSDSTEFDIDGDDVPEVIPIKYYVDMPDIGEIVFQASFGLNLGFTSEYVDVSGFAIRKPENVITSAAELTLNADNANVRVSPQVFFHDVFGTNVRLKYKRFALSFSTLSTRPNEFPEGNELLTEFTSIETEKRDEDYVGVGLDYESYALQTGLHYVARVSEFDLTGDVLATPPRWNQAVTYYLNARVLKNLDMNFDFKYDTLTFDRLYKLELSYHMDRNVRIAAGAEVIGTPEISDSFWYEFRNNDAVYGSLRYVF